MKYLVEVRGNPVWGRDNEPESASRKFYKELSWESVEYSTLDTMASLETIKRICNGFNLSYSINQEHRSDRNQDGCEVFTLCHIRGDAIVGILYLHCEEGRVRRYSGERHRHELLIDILRAGSLVDLEPIAVAEEYWSQVDAMCGK